MAFTLGTTPEQLQQQLTHARNNATGGGAGWNQRITQIQNALGNFQQAAAPAPGGIFTAPPPTDIIANPGTTNGDPTSPAGQPAPGALGVDPSAVDKPFTDMPAPAAAQAAPQGAFGVSPSAAPPPAPAPDYAAQRLAAENSVMDSFNRRMEPQFQQQGQDFRARMAARGIDEGSEAFQQMYQNEVTNPQTDARADAMSRAFQLGQSEQAQQFGQGVEEKRLNYDLGERDWQAVENERGRQFTSSERVAAQEFTTAATAAMQKWQSDEAGLDRDFNAALATQRISADEASQIRQIEANMQALEKQAQYGTEADKAKYASQLDMLKRELKNRKMVATIAANSKGGGGGGGELSMADRLALIAAQGDQDRETMILGSGQYT